jgi:probable F420-dependent oxidoreductase
MRAAVGIGDANERPPTRRSEQEVATMPEGTLQFWQSTIHAPADQLLGLARHAEDLGFEGAMGPDHTVWWGSNIASKYPYNDTGSIWWPEEAHWPDPWVSTAAMAAVTTRLRFGHHVFILPLRDPVNVAKAIATTSAIAGGRVVLGFGVGWMKEEFDLVGQRFDRRGRRTDEMLDVLQLLWSGDTVSYEGEFYSFQDIAIKPIPAQRVPLIAGGHSEAALRRAGTRCDGWLGAARFEPLELAPIIDRLNEHRAAAGRDTRNFELLISLRKRDHHPDVFDTVADMGVTGLMVAPWSIFPNDDIGSLDGKKRAMDEFANKFMR